MSVIKSSINLNDQKKVLKILMDRFLARCSLLRLNFLILLNEKDKERVICYSGLAQILKHGEKNKKTFHSSFGLKLSFFKGFEVATIFLA